MSEMKSRLLLGLTSMAMVAGCYGSEDALSEGEGEGEGAGVSATVVSELTVGGHYCPTRGEIAGRTIPSDNTYYITSFGGGVDTQRMACTGVADGRWMYIADSWRFGCRARVRVTNPRTGRWCVAQVADVGPNICVERAAGRPIIDASPVITRELFGRGSAGWSDRIAVRAELVPTTTPLGCADGTAAPSMTPAMTAPVASCFSGTYGREMAGRTCLQSRFDSEWYQCTGRGWALDRGIPSRRSGPAGACSAMISLR
ncbi:MAG: hypothetical protein KA978_15035 [Deltaproteobacteria bacterium]|nr:hypothetical protein [Deltaproteobacteria bacterium]